MFKNFFYSSLFFFSVIYAGYASIPTVLSITNLTEKSITLKSTGSHLEYLNLFVIEPNRNVSPSLSAPDESLSLDDIQINIKEDDQSHVLYPKVVASSPSYVWELTSNGIGVFSLVLADNYKKLLGFKREQKDCLNPALPVLPEGIMQSSPSIISCP